MERQLLIPILREDEIADDQPKPPVFQLGWDVEIDRFGIPIEIEYAMDSKGRCNDYRQEHPIRNR